MAMREFHLGTLLKVKATFKDPESVPTPNQPFDPGSVKLSVKPPNAAETTNTYTPPPPGAGLIQRTGVGVYTAEINLNALGVWTYRWFSEGVGQAAKKVAIKVIDVKVE